MQVWSNVKVIAPKHKRANTAGVVYAVDPKKPDVVDVKFDVDGVIESVATADLQELS